MAILSKEIYIFSSILFKTTTQFFTDLERPILNSQEHMEKQEQQQNRIAKIILNNKRTAGGKYRHPQPQIVGQSY